MSINIHAKHFVNFFLKDILAGTNLVAVLVGLDHAHTSMPTFLVHFFLRFSFLSVFAYG